MSLSTIKKFFIRKPQQITQYTPTIPVGEKLKNIKLENINDLLDVLVDENNNIFIKFRGNVTLLSEKNISIISGSDVNILSGQAVGREQGFINLNPIVKQLFNKLLKTKDK